jgi:hypothetical protein
MTETGTAWPSFEPTDHLVAAAGFFVGDPEDEDEEEDDDDDREEDDNEDGDSDEEEDGYSE